MATHYEVLGVGTGASTEEIRRAYYKLARTNHPDQVPPGPERASAEVVFTAMTDAFNVLTSPDRRQAYDTQLRQKSSGESEAQREAKSCLRVATSKISEGNHAEAVRLMRAAVHLDPGQGIYHATLAQALKGAGQLNDAIRAWDEALKREPYNPKYHRSAGECLEKAGMLTRARRMYENALKWDKNDSAAAEALARLTSQDSDSTGSRRGGLFKKA